MSLLLSLLYIALLLFLVLLLTRLAFTWIQQFARDWTPKGIVLVVAEASFTVTDPPLKAIRRVIPPLRIGTVALDLAFILVFILVMILMAVVAPFTL